MANAINCTTTPSEIQYRTVSNRSTFTQPLHQLNQSFHKRISDYEELHRSTINDEMMIFTLPQINSAVANPFIVCVNVKCL